MIEQLEETKMEVGSIKNMANTNIASNPCYDCGKKELPKNNNRLKQKNFLSFVTWSEKKISADEKKMEEY